MVSRRKILSRSRDDLNLDGPPEVQDEEDVWYQKEKLFKVRHHQSERPSSNQFSLFLSAVVVAVDLQAILRAIDTRIAHPDHS